jgi:WD40 repeat protein/serine/threonine protein kinase
VIGPYKLLQQIGEGGMGAVWMAEQTRPIQRRVALKLIKPGLDTGQVLARFEAERQALALMDHSNIARVLDAGETPPAYAGGSPRPYFVMELVKGVPMTRYCDEYRLTPPQRLELFIPVCQAVQHAHQKGVIHRDLKPSNVLVALYDGRPVPKVIDFGIAKAMGSKLTERTLFTEFGAVVGTLEYMSPEQAELNNLDIDTRSDVYSLGVLLYELLTGTTPLARKRLKGTALLEALRLIREEEPPRPSTRLSTTEELPAIAANRGLDPAKLSGLVRGELDWIVMKALEKDRGRRFDTANGLARDIERYLADEPVLACPPSAGYRLRKLLRRHRGPALVAALLLTTLVAGAAASAWQAVEATNARSKLGTTLDALKIQQTQKDEALAQERQASYYQSIVLADRELAANRVDLAGQLLQRCPPELRRWEWGYLDNLCHTELGTVRLPDWIGNDGVFSPDGRRFASFSTGQTAKVWDVETGQAVVLGNRTQSRMNAGQLAFSPDGRRVAWAHSPAEWTVWELGAADEAPREVFTLTVPPTKAPPGRGISLTALDAFRQNFWAVAFSPDGQQLAGAHGSATVRVWDLATRTVLWQAPGPQGHFPCAAFSRDGRLLATSATRPGERGEVKLWGPATHKELLTLRGNADQVLSLAFSPDGKRLASAGADRTVRVWDTATGQEVLMILGHAGGVIQVAFSPDGKRLASSSPDRSIKVWSAADGQELFTLRGHTAPVHTLAFTPDGNRILSAAEDHTVRTWDATDSRNPVSVRVPERLGSIKDSAFSPDGRRLTAAFGFEVRSWDTTTWESTISYHPPTGFITAMALCPDGGCTVLVKEAPDILKVVDATRGQELATVRTLKNIGLTTFRGDGKCFAQIDEETDPTSQNVTRAEFRVIDAATGVPLLNLDDEAAPLGTVAFSPDHRYLAAADLTDRTVKVWDAATGQRLPTFTGHLLAARCLAFSQDSRYLATGSGVPVAGPGELKVWDIATGGEAISLTGHSLGVLGLAFSPDGGRLASTSADKTVKVWELATGKELLTLPTASVHIHCLFSPDGGRLLTADGYGVLKVWSGTPSPQPGT